MSVATALGQDDLDAGPEFKAFLAKLGIVREGRSPAFAGIG